VFVSVEEMRRMEPERSAGLSFQETARFSTEGEEVYVQGAPPQLTGDQCPSRWSSRT
jgi:hypothetical protein